MREAVVHRCSVDRYKNNTFTNTVVSGRFCELLWTFGRLSSQPSSSCSFDGGLRTDQSDSEPNWPEVPPVLNQNEDRRRTKYLRKDYLKVTTLTRDWFHQHDFLDLPLAKLGLAAQLGRRPRPRARYKPRTVKCYSYKKQTLLQCTSGCVPLTISNVFSRTLEASLSLANTHIFFFSSFFLTVQVSELS